MEVDQASAEEIVTIGVEDAVGVITLRAPALSWRAKGQLLAGLRQMSGDDAVRAVVLTGSGRVFCAGQDLAEHAAALDADPASAFETLALHYHPIVLALTAMPKPVVAAINGSCAGAGISLALACDIRVCSRAAKFATAFTGIGLTFDSGLSATLTRAVGAARASELILLAEPFTALQALSGVLAAEQAAQSRLGQTADHKGAVEAFLAKRHPVFRGR